MVTSGVLTQRSSVLDCVSACKRLTRIAQRFARNFLRGFLHVVLRRQSEIHYRGFLWKNFRLGERDLRLSALVFAIVAAATSATVERLVRIDRRRNDLLLMATIVISPKVQWFHSSPSDPGPGGWQFFANKTLPAHRNRLGVEIRDS